MRGLECFICDEPVTLTSEDHPEHGKLYSISPMFEHLNTEHPGWEED